MPLKIRALLENFRSIFGFCPECDELFRLSDVYLYTIGQQPRSVFDAIAAEEQALQLAEDRLDDAEARLRGLARERGVVEARKILKRIDPVFSGNKLNPQDVKVLFDPIEYIVFDGMNRDKIRRVILMDAPARTSRQERIQRSIETTIRKGNYEWRTVRITGEGQMDTS